MLLQTSIQVLAILGIIAWVEMFRRLARKMLAIVSPDNSDILRMWGEILAFSTVFVLLLMTALGVWWL